MRDNNRQPSLTNAKNEERITTRLATGREEMIWRNLNLGTGRLDDPRPRGIGGPINPSPDAKLVSNNTKPNNASWFRTL